MTFVLFVVTKEMRGQRTVRFTLGLIIVMIVIAVMVLLEVLGLSLDGIPCDFD